MTFRARTGRPMPLPRLSSAIGLSLLAMLLTVIDSSAGVLARFDHKGRTDALVLPSAALYVAPGDSPTSFLEPGPYTVELSGNISVDLRAQYAFQVEAAGQVEVVINNKPVITFSGPGMSPLSQPVRLSKGTNSFVARASPGANGEIQFRLFWKNRNMAQAVPIPPEALSCDESLPSLRDGDLLRKGLAAFTEYRCAHCHLARNAKSQWDAPTFHGIGSRLRPDWMAARIANPGPDAHMPRLVSPADAAEIAAYLSTLQAPRGSVAKGSSSRGEKLFGELQCARCHQPDALRHVAAKFQPGALQEYLLNPQAHYRWNPMPNFKLKPDEAADLAAFLGEDPNVSSLQATARGKVLLQNSGCLNCHEAPLENGFSTKTLEAIQQAPSRGCLDPTSDNTPRFAFRAGEHEALKAFLESARVDALARRAPLDQTLHHTAVLGCAKCHDSADGVIRLDLIGGKLRPEWIEAFLDGKVDYKPRPWLAARMPAFHLQAKELAAGLAALHGVAPVTPLENPVDPALADAGARLVSAAGGFSCVACHAVSGRSVSGIVESPGIDLARSGERLLKSFFHRWVLNPIAIDPATKMPVYFDESGRSQLTEFFEGDAARQIEAIWHYVRLGDKMPAPPLP